MARAFRLYVLTFDGEYFYRIQCIHEGLYLSFKIGFGFFSLFENIPIDFEYKFYNI